VQARYSPGPYRVINTAYRINRGLSEQLDIGWQWPLRELLGGARRALGAGTSACSAGASSPLPGQGLGAGRWYSVGRLNLSLPERRLVDTLMGLEYDGGCWIGRMVFERLNSTPSNASTRLFLQLEFVGLARLGANPLRTLRDNIPRYQYLRDDNVLPTSRFQHYE
jgi:LPS-assembly protein